MANADYYPRFLDVYLVRKVLVYALLIKIGQPTNTVVKCLRVLLLQKVLEGLLIRGQFGSQAKKRVPRFHQDVGELVLDVYRLNLVEFLEYGCRAFYGAEEGATKQVNLRFFKIDLKFFGQFFPEGHTLCGPDPVFAGFQWVCWRTSTKNCL